MSANSDPEKIVREIKRKTRRLFSAEEKIRIVLEGFRGEDTIAELCRREGISPNLYYNWSKEFLEAGKRRLMGDTKREATSGDVTDLRRENSHLKELVADLALKNRVLKISLSGTGEDLDDLLGTPSQRSLRSSAWWNSRSCRLSERLPNCRSVGRRSTAGTARTGTKGLSA